jgi:hypothetical protein
MPTKFFTEEDKIFKPKYISLTAVVMKGPNLGINTV